MGVRSFLWLIYLTNITRRSAAFKVLLMEQFRKVSFYSETVLARSVIGFVRSFASYVCAVTRGDGGKGMGEGDAGSPRVEALKES